jgi:uncharacterized membrane protein YccF (DUF307 family)
MGRVLFVLIGLVVLELLNVALGRVSSKKKPPKCVKIVEYCEMTFGSLVLVSSVYFGAVEKNGICALLALIVGILWLILALAIYLGKRWASITCIILSLIRILSVIGIPFSVISGYIILFSKDFRSYIAGGRNEQLGNPPTEGRA